MKIDFKGILNGAWNSLFIKESVEAVHKERMEVCRKCSYNSETMKKESDYKTFRPDFHCVICGCNLDMKTRCMACECPEKKWGLLMSEKEEQEMNSKLVNNDKD